MELRLKPKGDGTATITVTQNGDSTYNAASNNNATFTIAVTEKSPYSDSLPGMILWLDANDINADGLAESNSDFITNSSKTQASNWADRSGSSNTLSQGSTSLQPVRNQWWETRIGIRFNIGQCRCIYDRQYACYSVRQSKFYFICRRQNSRDSA